MTMAPCEITGMMVEEGLHGVLRIRPVIERLEER